MSGSVDAPEDKLVEDIRRSLLVIPEYARKEVARFSNPGEWKGDSGTRIRISVTAEGMIERRRFGGNAYLCCPLGLCLFAIATGGFRARYYEKMQGPVDGGEFQTLLRLATENPSLGTDDDRFHWNLFIIEWDRGQFGAEELPELFGVEEVKGEG